MTRLHNKTIIITGGAQGIGASYARAVAAQGANVAVCDILDCGAISDEIGANGMTGICDVTDAKSVQGFVAEVIERFGRIDGLVNNAALFASLGPNRPFFELTSEEFDKMMQINVRGTFEFCKAVVPHMRETGYGKIVNVSSSTPFEGIPGKAHYVTSKGAVIALTRVIAKEVGAFGIRCNSIAPGFTLSEGVLHYRNDAKEHSTRLAAKRAIQTDQQPQDLDGTVVFLLSPDSDFMTGQTLVVDGGSALH